MLTGVFNFSPLTTRKLLSDLGSSHFFQFEFQSNSPFFSNERSIPIQFSVLKTKHQFKFKWIYFFIINSNAINVQLKWVAHAHLSLQGQFPPPPPWFVYLFVFNTEKYEKYSLIYLLIPLYSSNQFPSVFPALLMAALTVHYWYPSTSISDRSTPQKSCLILAVCVCWEKLIQNIGILNNCCCSHEVILH